MTAVVRSRSAVQGISSTVSVHPESPPRRDMTRWLSGSSRTPRRLATAAPFKRRSEEHTSELQSLAYLVCRLLLEKKKKNKKQIVVHIRNERHSSRHSIRTLIYTKKRDTRQTF